MANKTKRPLGRKPIVAGEMQIIQVRFAKADVERIKQTWGNVADFVRKSTLKALETR